MHHYECIALYKDISLQRGRFWASSLASCSSRSRQERLPSIVFIQVVCRRLQLSRGGSKLTWLASAFSSILTRCPEKERWPDLTMDESGGWFVIWRMSAFLTKSCQWTPRSHMNYHRTKSFCSADLSRSSLANVARVKKTVTCTSTFLHQLTNDLNSAEQFSSRLLATSPILSIIKRKRWKAIK